MLTIRQFPIKGWLSAAFVSLCFNLFAAPKEDKPLKIKPNQPAPTFMTDDVYGKLVSLESLRGKKVLLIFFRNVGCPVCNLRMHQLLEQAADFKSKGLEVISVYESTPENMKQYLQGETIPFTMVPNPDQTLYNLYALEISGGKAFKSMFHGVIGKAKKGKQLFKKDIRQDGNKSRIGADFLIDEEGKVVEAHYGRYIGDEISLEKIQQFINSPAATR